MRVRVPLVALSYFSNVVKLGRFVKPFAQANILNLIGCLQRLQSLIL